jgi:transposase
MLLVHLPGVDVVIDVESKICPCCGGSLHKIGEAVDCRHGGRRPIANSSQFELLANAVLGPAAGAVEPRASGQAPARQNPAMNSHHRISISPVPYGRHSGGTGGTGGTAGKLC